MMVKLNRISKLLLFIFLLVLNIYSQDYTQDSLAVRAILDSNSLQNVSVESVSDSNGGRIVELNLERYSLTSLPPEIGNLSSLERILCSFNKLKTLPAEIANIGEPPLYRADFSCNELDSLPSEIVQIDLIQGVGAEIDLCYNINLVFTEEQKVWANVEDNADYIAKYCTGSIEQEHKNDKPLYFINFYQKENTINYSIPHPGNILLEIFNINGKKVKTIFEGCKTAGSYYLLIKDFQTSSGMYYIRLSIGKYPITCKAVIIK